MGYDLQPGHFTADAPGTEALSPELVVESGKDAGRTFAVQIGETTIGRAMGNQVVLTDISVSRRHTRILREGPRLHLFDLGSGNGTKLNGAAVADAPLNDGDRISLGTTVLRVSLPAAKAATEIQAPAPASPFALPPGHSHFPGAATLPPGVAPPAHVEKAPKGRLVFLSALLLLGIGAAAASFVLKPSNGATSTTSNGAAPVSFEQGAAAFATANWDEAERVFGELLARQPTDARVMDFLQRLRQVREDLPRLEAAQKAIADGKPEAAVEALKPVTASSSVAMDAAKLRDRAQVMLHVEAGDNALAQGDWDSAQKALDAARAVDPEAELVQGLAGRIRAGRGSDAPIAAATTARAEPSAAAQPNTDRAKPTAPKSAGRSADSKPGASASNSGRKASGGAAKLDALASYKAERFDDATSRAKKGGLDKLAKQIEQFADHYRQLDGAPSPAVLNHMKRAIDLDRSISSGYYARPLRERLIEGYVGIAEGSFGSGKTASGCTWIRRALEEDKMARSARRHMAKCEKEARTIVDKAKAESNAIKAKALYRRAMGIVPGFSSVYKQAKGALDSL